jgi:cytochrome c peroxidase
MIHSAWLWTLMASVLSLSGLTAGQAAQADSAYDWQLPGWVPAPVVPADNPMTPEKVELGRYLFYDTRLSADGSMSCATCHVQALGFADGRSTTPGVTGEQGIRNSMALGNVAYLPALTWMNPQLTSMEIQTLIPLFGEHPVEMGMAGREQALWLQLQSDPTYTELFTAAFPEQAKQGNQALYSLSTLTKALSAFQRTLLSFDSPYDRYKYGNDPKAISDSAKRGETLFFGEKMECYHCHGGLNFTDNVVHERMPFPELGFHNTGLYNIDGKGSYPVENPGIVEFTAEPRDQGKFRTPSLRNVAVTAPYMHDGSIATLEEVLRSHYAVKGKGATSSGQPNPLRSELVIGFSIDEAEIADLLAFLHSLTDEQFLTDPRFANPWPSKTQ